MGFYMSRDHVSYPETCWKPVPGGRCVYGPGHPGPCSQVVSQEAWEQLCRLIGWVEPADEEAT